MCCDMLFFLVYISIKFILYICWSRLLDRDQIENEESTQVDEEENGFLKAFKVLHYFSFSILPISKNIQFDFPSNFHQLEA